MPARDTRAGRAAARPGRGAVPVGRRADPVRLSRGDHAFPQPGRRDLTRVASHDEAGRTGQPPDVDQVASLVLERIRTQLGLDQHRPMDIPPVDQAVALRDQAPELYELWLRIARERAATANYVERAPYEVPERLAQSGRPRALGALIVVLAFCGYLAWLGGPGPYIAGLIALVNLGVMVSIFFGLRPGPRPGPGQAGRPSGRAR